MTDKNTVVVDGLAGELRKHKKNFTRRQGAVDA